MKRIILMLLCLAAPLAAQQTDSLVTVPASMLTAAQRATIDEQSLNARMKAYGQWVGLGKEVGEAVNGSLSAVTAQANNFANTNVGKITVALVVWKVIGWQATQLVVGCVLFVVFLICWQWAFRKLALDHSVLIKINADKSKEYRIIEGDDKWKVGMWVSFFIGISICLLVIFVH